MTCLLPVGSYEQHGPHLPPTVDTEIAQYVARRLAERINAVVLPPVSYTCSQEHRHFPNTLYVSCSVFLQYLWELLQTAVEKCGKVIVVVGHGGVREAVILAVSQVNYLNGPRALALSVWDFVKIRDHAGTDETSVYLATGGSLAGEMRKICEGDVSLFGKMPVAHFSKSGVVGCLEPEGVSAERGLAMLEKALGEMYKKVGEFLTSG